MPPLSLFKAASAPKWRLALIAWFVCSSLITTALLAQSSNIQEAQLHYKVAQVALKHNDLNVALQELREAAKLAPQNALVHYYLAVVLKQQGGAKEGLEHLHLAMKIGLPVSERRAADNLLAELTYALKSQPLYDFIGTWSREEASKTSGNCTATITTKFRMVVSPQAAQGGKLSGDYFVSKNGSTEYQGCTFNATGTTLLNTQIRYKSTLSQDGDKVRMEMQAGQCSGDCAGEVTLGKSFLLSKTSADEVKLSDSSGEYLLVSETPSADYVARKNAEQDATKDRALSDCVGRWQYIFEGDETDRWGIHTGATTGKRWRDCCAGVHSKYVWDLALRQNGNSLTGSLIRSGQETLFQVSGQPLYDTFIFNGQQVTQAAMQVSYEVTGTMAPDGGISLSARPTSCSGNCDAIHNYPGFVGSVQTNSSAQLIWVASGTTRAFTKQ